MKYLPLPNLGLPDPLFRYMSYNVFFSSECDEGNSTIGTIGEFKCDNGLCIPSYQVCNYVDDCQDKSDEQGCSMSTFIVHRVYRTCQFKGISLELFYVKLSKLVLKAIRWGNYAQLSYVICIVLQFEFKPFQLNQQSLLYHTFNN